MFLKLRTPNGPGGEGGESGATAAAGRGGPALQLLPAQLREYFRYHGLLAPGVRLMRGLSVRGKAALLVATALLPLGLTLPLLLRGEAVSRDELRTLLYVLTCFLVAAAYMLMAFYRVTNGGLQHLNEQVSRMATGDLSMRPRPWGDDEIARAMHSLGQSLARLADLFAVVRQGVSASSHASREIASGNEDLSRRTVEAAEAIEGVLRGVGQYIEQLDACGERVDAAEAVVERMRVDAAHARHQMQQLEGRMHAMQGRSREIGEIVELIDNLAFRTNILALNASIEAAKAGEAGRGFAVVAQEVRGLAQRSAESAQRISDIIGRSTDDIGQADLLAAETGKALGRTDGQVDQIHDEMIRIVELTRAGQASSQDILAGLRALSELTQDNRRLVEQMAEASSALSGEGEHLARTVSSFKLT